MRHKVDHRKLNRTTEHRLAMLNNQAVSLILHDRITTTLPKAKELRRFVERLVTLAKKDTLHARRIAARKVKDTKALQKLFSELGPLYASRPGGYTRIMKLGFRRGDGAQEAIIEMVDREPAFEEKTPEKGKKKKKAAPKAEETTKPEEETSSKEAAVKGKVAEAGEKTEPETEVKEEKEATGEAEAASQKASQQPVSGQENDPEEKSSEED